MFSKDTYLNRQQTLQSNVSGGILLFQGNSESPMNFADNCFEFRQDSTFLYYFGIQQHDLYAAIDLDENQTVIFGDELTIDQIVWMGRQETLKEKAEKCGVSETRPLKTLADYLSKAKAAKRKIHFLPPYQPSNKILLSDLLGEKIQALRPSVEFIKAVVSQRECKEVQEVEEIEKAVHVSNEMHLLAMRMAKAGMKEYEIVGAILGLAGEANMKFSYPAIMTINGQILHNHYRMNTLKSGDMILNDSGAETAMGYAGDLTRTFPVDKRFTTRQREMYDIVLKAYEDARNILRPGLNYKEVHQRAALTLIEGLRDLGLLKGDPLEAVEHNVHTLFFQCGVGHLMGLDVHDMESLGEQYVGYTEDDPKDTETFGWKSLRLGRPLKEGFVLTVEPGIYIIPELIDIWQKERKLEQFVNYDKVNEYRDFGGIRIEDNFLITANGFRELGEGLIKTAAEVEDYRAEFLK